MAAPVNTILPAITGTVLVGQVLTSDNGTWTGATSYAYAWYRAGVAIVGATSATYTITTADIKTTLSCRVTATNVDGSTPADSASTISIPSTLIIETGAIITGADSYETTANADTYHANRGNAAWAALTEAAKEQAMRKAAFYLDGKYYHRWKGAVVSPLSQNLCWPRAGVRISDPQVYYAVPPSFYDVSYSGFIPITTIPQRLKDAQCEAALRASTDDLAADLQDGVKSQSIGGAISKTFSSTSGNAVKKYQVIDQLLTSLLNSGQDAIRG